MLHLPATAIANCTQAATARNDDNEGGKNSFISHVSAGGLSDAAYSGPPSNAKTDKLDRVSISEMDPDNHLQQKLNKNKSSSSASELNAQHGLRVTNYVLKCCCTMALIVILLSPLLVGMWYGESDVTDNACQSLNFGIFLCGLRYSLIIPSSYDISVRMGRGAVYSGFLISAIWVGTSIASVGILAIFRQYPDIWKNSSLTYAIACINFLGACLYCGASLVADWHVSSGSLLMAGMIVARVFDGLSQGLIMSFAMRLYFHIVQNQTRPKRIQELLFYLLVGTGVGPLFAAAVAWQEGFWNVAPHNLGAIGVAQLGVSFVIGVVLVAGYPKGVEMSSIQDHSTPTQQSSEYPDDASDRIIVQCGCLVLGFLRGFVQGSLEAATAFLLETSFGWSDVNIGAMIAACFLIVVPAQTMHNNMKNSVPLVWMVRLTTLIAVIATFFLFDWICVWSGKCKGWMILFADILLFPSLFLSESTIAGFSLQSQYLLPPGTSFDVSWCVLYRTGFCFPLSRLIGPPISRFVLENNGQNRYAVQQLMSTVAFAFLFELMITRRIKESVGSARK
jgi:hypothetical protein